jgi:hypothetical protein
MVERLDDDQRKRAMIEWRQIQAASHDLGRPHLDDEDDDNNQFGFKL